MTELENRKIVWLVVVCYSVAQKTIRKENMYIFRAERSDSDL